MTDNIGGNISVVKVEDIEDVISKKQAIKLYKQLYKKFNCDKMLLEENLRI